MLGQLLARQSDHTSVGAFKQHSGPSHGISTNPQTNDDAFTRTVLYGSQCNLTTHHLDKSKVRLVIIQSKGGYYERDNYRTLFDSNSVESCDDAHPIDVLIPKVFGNPIYQDFDSNEATKMIILDEKSVVISLHFKHRRNFAIAIVMPFSMNDFSTLVLSGWNDIKRYLQLLKVSFIRNHLMNGNNGSIRKIQSKLTSNYLDVFSIFKKFTNTLILLLETPRLLIGLTQKFDSILFSWCAEVNNWIEIKDGGKNNNSGSKFLISLLALINANRQKLISPKDELFRIVIMTSNPIISQKLIFIISGLLTYDLAVATNETKNEKPSEETIKPPRKNLLIEIPKTKPPTTSPTIETATSSISPVMHQASGSFQPQPSMIKKGWEIPKTPSKSVATPSVLSYSSSVSNLNSASYLSSSLSNSCSQSSLSASYISRSFQYLTNWGGISSSIRSNSSNNSSVVPNNRTPSPVGEYEEYPWNGASKATFHNPHSMHSQQQHPVIHHHNSSPSSSSLPIYRTNSTLELTKRKLKIPEIPPIQRTAITVSGLKAKNKTDSLKNQLDKLMKSSIKDSSLLGFSKVKNVSVLEVSFDNINPVLSTLNKDRMTLPRLTGFTQSYIPEFQLQACPSTPDLESNIINSMKMDLAHGEYEKTRTLFISLRVREIKEIVLTRNNILNSTVTTTPSNNTAARNPVLDANGIPPQQEYRSRVKRFYHSGHPMGIQKSSFEKMDALALQICRFVNEAQIDENGNDDSSESVISELTTCASEKDEYHAALESVRERLTKI